MNARRFGVIALVVMVLSGLSVSANELGTAEIEILPPRPGPSDFISARLSGTWPNSCVPSAPRMSRSGSEIRIDTSSRGDIRQLHDRRCEPRCRHDRGDRAGSRDLPERDDPEDRRHRGRVAVLGLRGGRSERAPGRSPADHHHGPGRLIQGAAGGVSNGPSPTPLTDHQCVGRFPLRPSAPLRRGRLARVA